jgi:hypothetical protein
MIFGGLEGNFLITRREQGISEDAQGISLPLGNFAVERAFLKFC